MSAPSLYRVRAVACDHRASEEEVYQALKRATAPMVALLGQAQGRQAHHHQV